MKFGTMRFMTINFPETGRQKRLQEGKEKSKMMNNRVSKTIIKNVLFLVLTGLFLTSLTVTSSHRETAGNLLVSKGKR